MSRIKELRASLDKKIDALEHQALALEAHVRKVETGSLVVYANSVTKTETTKTGEEVERDIPFLEG